MSESNHHETVERPTPEGPELDLLHYEDEGFVKLFEPDEMGAYIVVDEYNLMQLCECA
jgi:hypothetical protein